MKTNEMELLYGTRSYSNETNGVEMDACLARNGVVECYFPTPESTKRNAKLFSAAPELLAALRELREWGVDHYQKNQLLNGCVLESILTQADAAIAKATE